MTLYSPVLRKFQSKVVYLGIIYSAVVFRAIKKKKFKLSHKWAVPDTSLVSQMVELMLGTGSSVFWLILCLSFCVLCGFMELRKLVGESSCLCIIWIPSAFCSEGNTSLSLLYIFHKLNLGCMKEKLWTWNQLNDVMGKKQSIKCFLWKQVKAAFVPWARVLVWSRQCWVKFTSLPL